MLFMTLINRNCVHYCGILREPQKSIICLWSGTPSGRGLRHSVVIKNKAAVLRTWHLP